tara:strand:- start:3130 stop:4479 length:1350 start_codon:yes stop_codon:yes gene_type:complete
LGLKVLSLFDGMSCGQIALNRLGIKVDKYYASEIDKYAIEVTQKNFPDTIQVGDVCELKAEDYQDIDLIMAGSPCQGFSFAGKQLAFEDPRSALFFEFVRLLKAIKPKYFLLENVRMKKEYLAVITEQVSACYPNYQGNDLFGGRIEPIFINSALVSAQSRQRYYWTNIPGVEQPEDKGIVLRDILEDEYISEKDKSYCIDANYYKGASVDQYKKKSRRQLVSKKISDYNLSDKMNKRVRENPRSRAFKPNQKKSGALLANQAKTSTDSLYALSKTKQVGGAIRSRSLNKDGKHVDWKTTKPTQILELRKDKKSNAVSTVFKDSVVVSNDTEERIIVDEENRQLIIAEATKKGYTVIEDGDCFDINYPKSKTRRGRNMKYKCNPLTPTAQDYMRFENLTWRKLTPLECERLQTVPDNYTEGVSNTQRYKMLGNGWTVDVIAHILANMEL